MLEWHDDHALKRERMTTVYRDSSCDDTYASMRLRVLLPWFWVDVSVSWNCDSASETWLDMRMSFCSSTFCRKSRSLIIFRTCASIFEMLFEIFCFLSLRRFRNLWKAMTLRLRFSSATLDAACTSKDIWMRSCFVSSVNIWHWLWLKVFDVDALNELTVVSIDSLWKVRRI